MRKFGPKTKDNVKLSRKDCPACDRPFQIGDASCLISLGPGDDEDEQEKCRDGKPYNAVAVEVHWSCATGMKE